MKDKNFSDYETKKLMRYIQNDEDVLVLTSTMSCGTGSLAGIVTLIVTFIAKCVQEGDLDMGFVEEMPTYIKEAIQEHIGDRVDSIDDVDKAVKSKKYSDEISELKDILKSFSDLVDKVNK